MVVVMALFLTVKTVLTLELEMFNNNVQFKINRIKSNNCYLMLVKLTTKKFIMDELTEHFALFSNNKKNKTVILSVENFN